MISWYIVMFAVFSFIGWVFEITWCSLHDGYWQNRGFLFGPVCPIYGLGAMGIILIADVATRKGVSQNVTWWQLFLIGYIGSAILEYTTHYVLEKKFHATWWDYSEMPLNLNGRICVPASTLFGISYVVIFKYVYPWSLRVRELLPSSIVELAAVIIVAGFAVDTAVTISTLANFEKELATMNAVVNTNMESLLKLLKEKRQEDGGEETGEIKDSKVGLVLDIVKKRIADMDAFRASAITRVKSFNYPKLPKPSIDAIIEEIKKRNPFL